jgi:hypothetical protein
MSQPNSNDIHFRLTRALNKLIAQFIDHPDVNGIDVGLPPGAKGSRPLVLRVFVKKRWQEIDPDQRLNFPTKIDDIPVVVIVEEDQSG